MQHEGTFDRMRADRAEAARVEYAGRVEAARRGELGPEARRAVENVVADGRGGWVRGDHGPCHRGPSGVAQDDPRRLEIRETCRALSDRALAFQIGTGVGGMHYEELRAEQARRERGV
jgi:hypothetical protein